MKYITLFLFIGLSASMMTSCQNAPKGEKAVTEAAKKVVAPSAATKTYKADTGYSKVMWTGSKLAGTHTGTLNIAQGDVVVKDGKVVGGKFTVDMASLTCTDLKAGEGKEKLEGHLKSADFFDVAKNPTAQFVLSSVNNGTVTGNLTLNGMTKSISFPASVDITERGVSVASNDFTINRTDFGVKYGSSAFFDDLKDKAINDMVGLKIQFRAI